MNRLLNRLANLILLTLGVICLIVMVADSFSCVYRPSLLLWIAVSCILFWIAASFPRGLWIGLPLSAALVFAFYRFSPGDPLAELNDLLDHISGAFYTHVVNPGAAYPYVSANVSHDFVLFVLGFLFSAYGIAALTSKKGRVTLALLGSVPIAAACVIVNGSLPALPAAGLILYWFLVAATGNGYRTDGSLGRSFFCALIPVGLLVGLMLYICRPENYVYTEHDLEISRRFDRLNHYFDLLMGGNGAKGAASDPDHPSVTNAPRSHFQITWDGNDDNMELTEEYDFDHADQPVLRVKAERSGQIYLRTRSFGDYTGTGWGQAEELNAGSSLPFAAFSADASADGIQRSLEVRTLMDLDDLCLPYYSAVSSGSDAYVSNGGQDSYLITYTEYFGDVSGLRIPAEAQGAEQSYRSHAHSVYTRLPESTRQRALEICQAAGLQPGDPELVEQVAAYICTNANYDLETEPYPSDDYAIYFLTEAHRGYCIHYATAAAVLYRALDIPARVTEGFLTEVRAGRSTDVLAGSAHAWVEIYRDGVGWIPVEVTKQPGYITEEPSPAPESPEPSGAPPETPEPSGGGGGGGGGTEPSPSPEPTPEVNVPDRGSSFKFPWELLLSPLVLLLLLPLWYWLLRAYWTTQIRNQDGRRAAIAFYRYAEKVSGFGSEIPEIIVQTAERSAFSPHLIRREELDQCRTELENMINALYPGLTKVQKFRFRILRGLK